METLEKMAFQVSQFDICSIYNQTPIALKLSPVDQLKWNRLNYVLFHVTKKNLTMSFLYLKYLSFLVPTFNIPLNEMKCFLRMACSFLTSFATISQQRLFQLYICCLDQCLPNVSVLTNHLGVLLKIQVLIQQFWGLVKILTSSQVMPQMTLWIASTQIHMTSH